jgi:hypothetical protein
VSETKTAKRERKSGRATRLVATVTFWFAVNLLALVALLVAHFGTAVSTQRWWPDVFAVVTNLLAGGIVSFLFYYLVVYYPERRKKNVIKNNLGRMYRSIKRDILWQVVFASVKGGRHDLSTDLDTVERLMTPTGFKAAFDGGRQADEGFYAFQNQMSEETPEFREIVLSLQMLSKQIEFALHNYSVDDQKLFDFFKRLEMVLLALQQSKPGYDESKGLCRFIWEIFAGWDWIEGDRGFDLIEKMIADV